MLDWFLLSRGYLDYVPYFHWSSEVVNSIFHMKTLYGCILFRWIIRRISLIPVMWHSPYVHSEVMVLWIIKYALRVTCPVEGAVCVCWLHRTPEVRHTCNVELNLLSSFKSLNLLGCVRTFVVSLSHSCGVAWLRLFTSYPTERPRVSSRHAECQGRSGSHVSPASCFLPWGVWTCFLVLAFYSQPVESCTEYVGLLATLVFLGQLYLQTQQFACTKRCLTALKSNHIP